MKNQNLNRRLKLLGKGQQRLLVLTVLVLLVLVAGCQEDAAEDRAAPEQEQVGSGLSPEDSMAQAKAALAEQVAELRSDYAGIQDLKVEMAGWPDGINLGKSCANSSHDYERLFLLHPEGDTVFFKQSHFRVHALAEQENGHWWMLTIKTSVFGCIAYMHILDARYRQLGVQEVARHYDQDGAMTISFAVFQEDGSILIHASSGGDDLQLRKDVLVYQIEPDGSFTLIRGS